MVKVFRLSSPLSILIGIGLLLGFTFIGLPLLLLLVGIFVLSSLIRGLFGSPSSNQARDSSYTNAEGKVVSPVIHNDKIGDYRVIENPAEPDVIEVKKL
ncbi:MAG: hypothetical protein R3A80_11000 [Bdellovibrionota bacterium]